MQNKILTLKFKKHKDTGSERIRSLVKVFHLWFLKAIVLQLTLLIKHVT